MDQDRTAPGRSQRPKHRRFDLALSIGPKCRARDQLRRVFAKEVCPSGIFDSQRTYTDALIAYIRCNFAGMFELSDLFIEKGLVVHRRLNTRHRHEFPERLTEEALPLHYPKARERHDYLARKTLGLLRGDKKLLLCLGERIPLGQYLRIWLTLRLHFPLLRFILLNGPKGDYESDGPGWRGNDALWDAHLAGYRARPKHRRRWSRLLPAFRREAPRSPPAPAAGRRG